MWPVMTLTLLLQLTDDEQLYAAAPVVQPPAQEQQTPTVPAEGSSNAPWPSEVAMNG
ncbi:MAG: hypothetical protein IPP33_10865 [Flavobacteriales bacterium]|nr:hypothetical protein [Flavobacteriales bacterium]